MQKKTINKVSALKEAVCKFGNNSVSFTVGKLSIKMCKLRSGVKVTTKSSNGVKKDKLWNSKGISLTSNEHSHKNGDEWKVTISHLDKDRINCSFPTRNMARDFVGSFKKTILTK